MLISAFKRQFTAQLPGSKFAAFFVHVDDRSHCGIVAFLAPEKTMITIILQVSLFLPTMSCLFRRHKDHDHHYNNESMDWIASFGAFTMSNWTELARSWESTMACIHSHSVLSNVLTKVQRHVCKFSFWGKPLKVRKRKLSNMSDSRSKWIVWADRLSKWSLNWLMFPELGRADYFYWIDITPGNPRFPYKWADLNRTSRYFLLAPKPKNECNLWEYNVCFKVWIFGQRSASFDCLDCHQSIHEFG